MNSGLRIAIVAEIGRQVGWGHVSRSAILRRTLGSAFSVEIRIVNRDAWEHCGLRAEFELRERLEADIVFADGLQLHDALEHFVSAKTLVSLSYVSDVNAGADLVVAPALNGMEVEAHYLTDLEALLCNRPTAECATRHGASDVPTIGLCMGGADVDHIGPVIEAALSSAGFRLLGPSSVPRRRRTLSEFLQAKLWEREADPYPYYGFAGCDLAVCQGGLSAIELALLGIPTVTRKRSDFAVAYEFLETMGCSRAAPGDDIDGILATVERLCRAPAEREQMAESCRVLGNSMQERFWLSLVERLSMEGVCREAMPLLRG